MDNYKRGNFSGKLGFVLAAAGSAVGLGNIWRFPYLAAKYGGGIFLFVYLILAVTFGFALLMAEIAIGRKTGLSAVGAFGKLRKKYSFIGYLASVVPMIILPYYCVIGGWVTKYLAGFAGGQMTQLAATTVDAEGKTITFFGTFVGKVQEPLLWFFIFLALTAIVVLFGVEKGVEKISKFMMPVLIVLCIFIAGYALFIPGAMGGLRYYLLPDFSKFSVTTVLAAMGQLFYSMSLAMGIMVTYGSYMKKDVNIESSAHQIEIFDTGVAFLSGLMIIPAVFALGGGDPAKMEPGPGLMFEALPRVFEKMPAGNIIGAVFFILVLFAALTSSISLMETVVSIFRDRFHVKRWIACICTLGVCLLLGIPSSLGNGIWGGVKILGMSFLDFFDFISNSVLMPIVALLTCIFVGYIIKPKTIIEEVEVSGKFKLKTLFKIVIKYFAPICIILILVTSILTAMKVFEI